LREQEGKKTNISHLGGDCSHGGEEAEVEAPLKTKRKEKER